MVDRELQLGLASRLLLYWCATWLAVFACPIMTQMFMTDVTFSELAKKMINDLWFPMFMSLFMLPIVARDCVRFSNRIAGPIWRLKQTLRDVNDGKLVRKLKLRKDDYCQELADEVNRIVEKSSGQHLPQISACDQELRVATNESAAS
jgi:signal transduction histidine kinase